MDKTMERFDPQQEPLLREDPSRFVIFPINYQGKTSMSQKVSHSIWLIDYDSLYSSDIWRYYKKAVASFMATKARSFYGFQIMMENIHSEMYAKLIENLIHDTTPYEYIFRLYSKKFEIFEIPWNSA